MEKNQKQYSSNEEFYQKMIELNKQYLKVQKLQGDKSKKLNEVTALELLEKYYAYIYDKENDMVMLYDYDTKLYTHNQSVLRRAMRALIGEVSKENTIQAFVNHLGYEDHAYKAKIPDFNYLATKDCLINLDTMEQYDYSIDWFITSKINTNYIERDIKDYQLRGQSLLDIIWNFANHNDDRFIGLKQIIYNSITKNKYGNEIIMLIGKGGSGKSTFGELIESIVGKNNVSNITLEDTSDENKLLNLMNKHVMIGDDINDEVYLDKLKHLKSLSSGKTTIINRKYKTAISMDFNGLIIQNLPTMIKMRDREGQLKRRMLYFKFENSFIDDGIDPNEITEFINQQEVKEALLYYILNEPGLAEMEEYIGNDKDFSDEMTELNDPYYELDQYIKNHTQLYQADRISISVLTALFNDLQENDVDSHHKIKSKTLSSHFRSYLEEQGYVKNKNSLMQNTDNIIYINNNDDLIEEKNDDAIEEKNDSNDILFESSTRYLHLTPNVENLMHKQGRSSFYERK